jgi:hypothetical protein
MKIVLTMVIVAAVAGAASAQETQTVDERIVIKKMLSEAELVGAKGAFLGAAVKGAPYTGEEVTETTQMLADGTRIHNESRTTVYRDSDGRVRRESPDAVTIWDPVGNASYFLNTKSQTYRQMPLAVQFMAASTSKDGAVGFAIRMGNGPAAGGGLSGGMMLSNSAPALQPPAGAQVFVAQRMGRMGGEQSPPETLGRQTMEGVAADGTRRTETIEAGAIGNDRAIQITSERWYSPDLQTVVLTKHNDPRTGEEIFRLINVNRGEQPANLFTIPPGYQKLEK